MRHLILGLLLTTCSLASAADQFALVTLGELEVEGEPLPQEFDHLYQADLNHQPVPVVIVGGEAWLSSELEENSTKRGFSLVPQLPIAVRASIVPVKGRLVIPLPKGEQRVVRFTVPASKLTAKPSWQWQLTAALVDRELIAQRVPGAAWFRQRLASNGIAERPRSTDETGRTRVDDLEQLMDLVGGTRAIAENLALDRRLLLTGGSHAIVRLNEGETLSQRLVEEGVVNEPAVRALNHLDNGPVAVGTLVLIPTRDSPANALTLKANMPTVMMAADEPITGLPGIDTPAIDWKKHPFGAVVADPAAALIPEDQHAVFAADLPALFSVMDAVDQLGTPLRSLVEDGSIDADIGARYRRQLCLDASDLAKLLGPTLVQQLALTGSDPFVRSGSDLAVIFTPKQPALLLAALGSRQEAALISAKATRSQGTLGGTAWSAVTTPDREICSYVATVSGQIIVTNSLVCLQRLADTAAGKIPPLGGTSDYRFFRNRYPATQGGVLAVLSDATIRRWSSAAWRIGDARRQQAAARLAGLAIAAGDWVVEGRGAVPATITDPLLGTVDFTTRLGVRHVRSSIYNTVAFLTPLSEAVATTPNTATAPEAAAYRQWLAGYRRAWSRAFDPIAIQVVADAERIATDVTVMPLSRQSDMREFVELTRGGALVAGAGDPHIGSLVQLALAIDLKSHLGRQADQTLSGIGAKLGLDPLRWIGSWASIGLEGDDAWLKAQPADDDGGNFTRELTDLPVLVHIPSRDPLALAAFMTGIRGMSEQAAPGLVTWGTRTRDGHSYVAITPAEGSGMPSLFYATTVDALILSANENTLLQALLRHAQKPPAAVPWLGDHVGLRLAPPVQLLKIYSRLNHYDDPLRQVRLRSWSQLTLLSSLAARFPNTDPAIAWQRLTGERPRCAGGKGYSADADGFFSSNVYGAPWHPAGADVLPSGVAEIGEIQAGATFEDDGLRARLVLQRHAVVKP